MNFTGKSLHMLRYGIDLAIMEIHNQIATCPDVFEYAEDLQDLEYEKIKFERLLDRIERGIEREQNKEIR